MPTKQELNLSADSLSLIKQRDTESGVIQVNPIDSNVDIKIKNNSFEIDNDSVNEHIDTAFSYYKFPARVIIEDVSDADLLEQLNAVTIDTKLYNRYQADEMVLPNLNINSIGSPELNIISNPSTSFVFDPKFFAFSGLTAANMRDEGQQLQLNGQPLTLNKTLIKQLFYLKEGTTQHPSNNFFKTITPMNPWELLRNGSVFYKLGLRLYLNSIDDRFDPRYNPPTVNAITGDQYGMFIIGSFQNTDASKIYDNSRDEFWIHEPYLHGKLDLNTSHWFTIYNSVRYTSVGRRIVELDRLAAKQIRDNKSRGRYILSTETNKEFDHIKFREYDWKLSYTTNERVTNVKPSKGGFFQYTDSNGNLIIPEQTFRLNYTFDSILNENFKEISFNQVIDGTQQLTNRFTVTKDILGYNQDLMFDINIGLSHMNAKNTFIIRILKYEGDTGKPYTVIKQVSHFDLIKNIVYVDSGEKDRLAKQHDLEAQIITVTTEIAKIKKDIETNLAEYKHVALLVTNIDSNVRVAELYNAWQAQIKEYNTRKADRDALKASFGIFMDTKETSALAGADAMVATEKRKMDAAYAAYWNYRADLYNQLQTYVDTVYNAGNTLKTNLASKEASLLTLQNDLRITSITERPLTTNSKIILGLMHYVPSGKCYLKIKHLLKKTDLTIFDSYAVEILTNSPTTIDIGIEDSTNDIPMELIVDNTSWEIRPYDAILDAEWNSPIKAETDTYDKIPDTESGGFVPSNDQPV